MDKMPLRPIGFSWEECHENRRLEMIQGETVWLDTSYILKRFKIIDHKINSVGEKIEVMNHEHIDESSIPFKYFNKHPPFCPMCEIWHEGSNCQRSN